MLREKGINRIGNLLVPNDNYCAFEDWIIPVLNQMLEEQHKKKTIWSPSKICTRLGEEIGNENSVLYWAAVNHIPVFCPALTDGSLGDMIYMHSYRNPGLIVDIAQDIRRLNSISVKSRKSGMIIIGGGVVKHHICNANLMVSSVKQHFVDGLIDEMNKCDLVHSMISLMSEYCLCSAMVQISRCSSTLVKSTTARTRVLDPMKRSRGVRSSPLRVRSNCTVMPLWRSL